MIISSAAVVGRRLSLFGKIARTPNRGDGPGNISGSSERSTTSYRRRGRCLWEVFCPPLPNRSLRLRYRPSLLTAEDAGRADYHFCFVTLWAARSGRI